MQRTQVFLLVMFAAIGSAQEAPPPVAAKRVPPEGGREPRGDSVVDRYDFAAQVRALDATMPVSPATAVQNAAETATSMPKDYKPKKDVPLSTTAREAVGITERWFTSSAGPAIGSNGRVLFSYGSGLPTVVCAPLRVCMVELQSGEKLVGEPHVGDAVRWNISPALYGKGDSATSIIVIKPQSPGLDTNMLVTTARRAYYLRLISKPDDYVARVAFACPDEMSSSWQEHIAEQNRRAENTRIADQPAPGADALHFDYELKGDEKLRPVRVFDDGSKTFLQVGPGIRNREAPVLIVIGPDKKPEMVNYRVKGDMYIVDRLFDRAQLVLGSGKKARKAEITRETEGK